MPYTVARRTFEAGKFPPGSPERDRLNLDNLTSEYMTSYRYVLRLDGEPTFYASRNKSESEARAEDLNRRLAAAS